MYSLIVKGPMTAALKAARKRELDVKSGYEIDEGPDSMVPVSHVVLFVEDSEKEKVADWFVDKGPMKLHGYPFGTCLAFTYHPGRVPEARVQLWSEAIRKDPRWQEYVVTNAS